MRIVTIVQARLNSTRLPHKILLPLADEPLLLKMLERVRAATHTGKLIVAATNEAVDDKIEEICLKSGYEVYRGHPTDLLDRHYRAAKIHKADAVVKIPSDCPLIDPGIIDKVLDYYTGNSGLFDYVSNLHPATYPDGNDVEVMSLNAIKDAWQNAAKNFEREHTTPYIWENADKFHIGNVSWETGLNYSMTHRFTIDYEEDYIFIKKIYDELYHDNPLFSLHDILFLLEKQPDIRKINEKYNGVNWYRNHINELKTVTPAETKII